jgi:hypothetical protein
MASCEGGAAGLLEDRKLAQIECEKPRATEK